MKYLRVAAGVIAGALVVLNLAVAGWMWALNHSGERVIVVTGGSMEPVIHLGSAIVVDTRQRSLPVGTVVTFRSRAHVLTTHRIVSKHLIGGRMYLQTKGDANPVPDPDFTAESSVIGVRVSAYPYVGYLVTFLFSSLGRAVTIGPAFLLIFLTEAWRAVAVLTGHDEESGDGEDGAACRPGQRRGRRRIRWSGRAGGGARRRTVPGVPIVVSGAHAAGRSPQ